MQVITNHQYRNLEYGYQLSTKERAEFDYINEDEFDSHDFLRYRGVVYDVSEFERSNIAGWDSQHCDSFFSAVVIKYEGQDFDRVMVGLALS